MIDWQVYALNGRPVPGEGTSRENAHTNGVPHAAAHVWFWKQENGETYLLFQEPAPKIAYKAGLLDISAAGHVDIGEDEITAAIRETKEELGVTINTDDLYFVGTQRYRRTTESFQKDEFRFIYTVECAENMSFTFPDGAVSRIEWIKAEKPEDILSRDDFDKRFVQHNSDYFSLVFSGVAGHKMSKRITS